MPEEDCNPTSDEQMARAILDGDQQRFAELLDQYRPALLLTARSRLGDAVLAEDVVQDTILRAFRYLDTFNPNLSFRTWIWTILYRRCEQVWKKQQRDRDALTQEALRWEASQEQYDVTHPGCAMESQEQSALLHRLLTMLPDVQADALRLRFFGGFKFPEIAEIMESSVSAAKQRVRMGLVALSAQIRRNPALCVELPPFCHGLPDTQAKDGANESGQVAQEGNHD